MYFNVISKNKYIPLYIHNMFINIGNEILISCYYLVIYNLYSKFANCLSEVKSIIFIFLLYDPFRIMLHLSVISLQTNSVWNNFSILGLDDTVFNKEKLRLRLKTLSKQQYSSRMY